MRLQLTKEDKKRFIDLSTRANGKIDWNFYNYMVDKATRVQPAKYRKIERVQIEKKTRPEIDKYQQRKSAAEFLVKNYSREERYLIILSRDITGAVDAFTKNTFKTPEKREQKRWDLLFDFRTLISRKSEYKWSVRKLLENGIDFFAVRTLINSLFSAQELAS